MRFYRNEYDIQTKNTESLTLLHHVKRTNRLNIPAKNAFINLKLWRTKKNDFFFIRLTTSIVFFFFKSLHRNYILTIIFSIWIMYEFFIGSIKFVTQNLIMPYIQSLLVYTLGWFLYANYRIHRIDYRLFDHHLWKRFFFLDWTILVALNQMKLKQNWSWYGKVNLYNRTWVHIFCSRFFVHFHKREQ